VWLLVEKPTLLHSLELAVISHVRRFGVQYALALTEKPTTTLYILVFKQYFNFKYCTTHYFYGVWGSRMAAVILAGMKDQKTRTCDGFGKRTGDQYVRLLPLCVAGAPQPTDAANKRVQEPNPPSLF